MDPKYVYWAGLLLFFALGLGLLIRAQALSKRLVWLYLLLSTAVCGLVELRFLNKQFLPVVFRDAADVCLMLPIPVLAAAVFLLVLNAVVNLLPERWTRKRVSVLEVLGVALAGQFLFRSLFLLGLYMHGVFSG
jgi:hypothetical protein